MQPASATLVTTGSGPITYNISDPLTVGTATPTLAGIVTLSNFDFNGLNTVSFDISVKNTSTAGGLSGSDFNSIRLISFGFNTNPNATGVTDTSGVYNTLVNSNTPTRASASWISAPPADLIARAVQAAA